ncbi:MAG: hypothetical protein PGN13_01180 [Patulibacter minatonensis]
MRRATASHLFIAFAWAAMPAGAHAAPASVVELPDDPAATTPPPAVHALPIRSQLDDLAVRPDGTIIVATESNATYSSRPPRPSATAVRFGPADLQLPTLVLQRPASSLQTTQTAVTVTGAVTAWASGRKPAVAWVQETADDGTASPPQQLSSPGRSAWPIEAASGGGTTAVAFIEDAAGARRGQTLHIAVRAAGSASYRAVAVPRRAAMRDFYEARMAFGASGDGALLGWSNERRAASLWRIAPDGTVGPEMVVPLGRPGYVDALLAVGDDGTIAATFGIDRPGRDEVLIVQSTPAATTLAPPYRVMASPGTSLSTQGVGLAVSPSGGVLASFGAGDGSQVLVEGHGRSLRRTDLPYVDGGSTVVAWMPDGTPVAVFEQQDTSTGPAQLVAVRGRAEGGFHRPTPIAAGLTPAASVDAVRAPSRALVEPARLRALAPAADGSAVLAWTTYDGRRERLFVARISP